MNKDTKRCLVSVNPTLQDNVSLGRFLTFWRNYSDVRRCNISRRYKCAEVLSFEILKYNILSFNFLHYRSGGGVVKLWTCGARGPGFESRSHHFHYIYWVSPASKLQYDWNIVYKRLKSSKHRIGILHYSFSWNLICYFPGETLNISQRKEVLKTFYKKMVGTYFSSVVPGSELGKGFITVN